MTRVHMDEGRVLLSKQLVLTKCLGGSVRSISVKIDKYSWVNGNVCTPCCLNLTRLQLAAILKPIAWGTWRLLWNS
jgi:hypothetical protein